MSQDKSSITPKSHLIAQEQREEENKFKEILDNLKIIGDNKLGLYELNKSLNPYIDAPKPV